MADEPQRTTRDELRTLFLFESLADDQLDWLVREGHVVESRRAASSPRARRRPAATC